MSSRLERVQEVLDEALDLPEPSREEFVRRACDDPELSGEVLSLLRAYSNAEKLMPDPRRETRSHAPELRSGELIGAYEVETRIGAGGMGVVYRARDTRLARSVALKTVASNLIDGSHGWTRLEREARALAALNHPSIAQIHALERAESGAIVLVLELVEGPTLAESLARGTFPPDRAVRVATSICEGLAAAHAAGIVHRDLKPANIKLVGDEGVKLLDFGLAKETVISPDDPAPTRATIEGAVMGTASYMSPEQARGLRVDARTDIWALGCVLFEMLTGTQAFRGQTNSDCIASVLTREPDWSLLPRDVPAHVPGVLRRCLEKHADERWHSAADVRLELLAPYAHPDPAPIARRSILRSGAMLAGALAFGGGAGYILARTSRTPSPSHAQRLRFRIETSPLWLIGGVGGSFTLARDGRSLIASVEQHRNTLGLLARYRFDRVVPEYLPEVKGAWAPTLSHDGSMIAFSEVGRCVQVRRLSDNTSTTYPNTEIEPYGLAWLDDNTLVVASNEDPSLKCADLRTGQLRPLTTLDAAKGECVHVHPRTTSGSRFVHFTCITHDPQTSRFEQSIHAVNADTGARSVVLRDAYRPCLVAQDRLVFGRGKSIRSIAFDPRRQLTMGDSIEVAQLATCEDSLPFCRFDASPAGVLVLDPSPRTFENSEVSYSVFGGGTRTVIHTGPEAVGLDISRDERKLVITMGWVNHAVVVYNLDTGSKPWLGKPTSPTSYPLFSPDARLVAFYEQPGATHARLLIAPADTSSTPRLLIERHDATALIPCSFTPDGASLFFTMTTTNRPTDIYRIPIGGGEPQPLLPDEGKIKRMSPALSPDGSLLAFSSTIGGDTALYLAEYPDHSARIRVSKRLGMRPQWSADSRHLFYCDFEDLYRVEVSHTPKLAISEPELLVKRAAGFAFRVAPSGQGVYMCSPPGDRELRPSSLEVMTGIDWKA